MHQNKNAQESGYDDKEIIGSVIASMVPSLTLRNVLETTSTLTLHQLLTSMVQLPDESTYLYVMRCIATRQKLLLASQKSDLVYDCTLIQKLFTRTLERAWCLRS